MSSVAKSDGPKVRESIRKYAEHFGVVVKAEKYGIYGNEWDWVASPEKPSWYPNAQPFRVPVAADPKIAIRAVAERMGTGKSVGLNRFVLA